MNRRGGSRRLNERFCRTVLASATIFRQLGASHRGEMRAWLDAGRFPRDKFLEILAQLPDDPEDSVSQSRQTTPLDLSLLPDEQQQGTTQEAQSNATVAVPAQEQELAQDSSGMHSQSQPDSSKKAAEAAFAARLRADEKKNTLPES